jgi:hypothetical protein
VYKFKPIIKNNEVIILGISKKFKKNPGPAFEINPKGAS